MRSVNPATGEVFAEYAEHAPAVVRGAIDAAQAAFGRWRRATFAERARPSSAGAMRT
jgi:acyl-CoA reductase-like NAD-dependent aldehyde dehydrogenase